MKKKVLVTGSAGMLGWGIKQVFNNEEFEMTYTDRDTLDVTNYLQVMNYADGDFDIIIHCAAETNHLKAEIEHEKTYLVNSIGTAFMCSLAKECDAVMIYIGTCGMFDGNQLFYSPADKPSPLNHYGHSKWFGEELVKSIMRTNFYILRAGWMMGGGADLDHKFIGQIYKSVKKGTDIYAINDVYGTPTYSPNFALFIKRIIELHYVWGTYHYRNGRATRYDVAREFVELLGCPVKVNPISYRDYHDLFPCEVPYTKCEALESDFRDITNKHWEYCLKEYVERCFT